MKIPSAIIFPENKISVIKKMFFIIFLA